MSEAFLEWAQNANVSIVPPFVYVGFGVTLSAIVVLAIADVATDGKMFDRPFKLAVQWMVTGAWIAFIPTVFFLSVVVGQTVVQVLGTDPEPEAFNPMAGPAVQVMVLAFFVFLGLVLYIAFLGTGMWILDRLFGHVPELPWPDRVLTVMDSVVDAIRDVWEQNTQE